jgi:DNA-directed RNA polymerase subunit beta'
LSKESYDELLVQDGQSIGRGTPMYKKDGKEFNAPENGSVRITDGVVRLLDHPTNQVVKAGSELVRRHRKYVPAGAAIVTFDPFSEPIITEEGGFTHFVDIKLGTTLIEELNSETGKHREPYHRTCAGALSPTIQITTEKNGKGDVLASYQLPGNSYLQVKDNVSVANG